MFICYALFSAAPRKSRRAALKNFFIFARRTAGYLVGRKNEEVFRVLWRSESISSIYRGQTFILYCAAALFAVFAETLLYLKREGILTLSAEVCS